MAYYRKPRRPQKWPSYHQLSKWVVVDWLPLAIFAMALLLLTIATIAGVPRAWVGGSCPSDFKYVGDGRCAPDCSSLNVGGGGFGGSYCNLVVEMMMTFDAVVR